MFKVAVAGLPGTGKTSLVREVRTILSLRYSTDVLEEITGRCPYDSNQRGTFAAQFFYMTTQINEENLRREKSPDILLCDRCILDQWVYWQRHVGKGIIQKNLLSRQEIMNALFRFWLPSYHLIIHLRCDTERIMARPPSSELRHWDLDKLNDLEERYREALEMADLPVREVWNNQSIEEAAQSAVSIITGNLGYQ